SRSLHEEHELARGHQRNIATEVVGHEREREIHPCGHARRGPHVAVTYEDRIGVDGDVGIDASEVVARAPMRRRAPALEYARSREEERARAHRRDPAATRRGAPDSR